MSEVPSQESQRDISEEAPQQHGQPEKPELPEPDVVKRIYIHASKNSDYGRFNNIKVKCPFFAGDSFDAFTTRLHSELLLNNVSIDSGSYHLVTVCSGSDTNHQTRLTKEVFEKDDDFDPLSDPIYIKIDESVKKPAKNNVSSRFQYDSAMHDLRALQNDIQSLGAGRGDSAPSSSLMQARLLRQSELGKTAVVFDSKRDATDGGTIRKRRKGRRTKFGDNDERLKVIQDLKRKRKARKSKKDISRNDDSSASTSVSSTRSKPLKQKSKKKKRNVGKLSREERAELIQQLLEQDSSEEEDDEDDSDYSMNPEDDEDEDSD